MRVYLDTAPIIYIVEAVEPFATLVLKHLSAQDVAPTSSELSRLECRVKPLRDGDQDLLADYNDYFGSNFDEWCSHP